MFVFCFVCFLLWQTWHIKDIAGILKEFLGSCCFYSYTEFLYWSLNYNELPKRYEYSTKMNKHLCVERVYVNPMAWGQVCSLLCICNLLHNLKTQPLIDQKLVTEVLNNTLNSIKIPQICTLSGLVAVWFISIALHHLSSFLPFFYYFWYLPVVSTAINAGCLLVSCGLLSLCCYCRLPQWWCFCDLLNFHNCKQLCSVQWVIIVLHVPASGSWDRPQHADQSSCYKGSLRR